MNRTFYAFIIAFCIASTAQAQIPNDDCAAAIGIGCGEVISGTTTGALADDASDCGTPVSAPGVWYLFQGIFSQVTATTCSNFGYDTKINVYRGSCDALVCVGGNDDFCETGSSITFVAEEGVSYYIFVNGYDGEIGDFDLAISCAPVDEDDCLGALALECGTTVSGSTADALNDAAPDCGTTISAPGVWYTFTGIDGQNILSTCGAVTSYDSKMSVYTGSCNELVCVAGNDDTPGQGTCSTVIFNSTEGTTYHVLVQGYDGATGDYELSLICQTCGTPLEISITELDVNAFINWESANAGSQYSVEYGPAGFTPGTGTVITGTYGVDGPPVNITGLTAATEYDVYVTEDCGGGDVSLPAGPITFTTLDQPPASNAFCATPLALVCGSTVEGDTQLGLLAQGPVCGPADITANGLWYSFTGTGEEVTISTCDETDFDSKISVFTGTCEELICASGNDDSPGCDFNSSSVTFVSTAGTAYLILVHGYDQDEGLFTISVTCAPPCSAVENDQCANATVLSVQPIGACEASTGTNICAYAPAVPNPPCDPWASIVDVWYSFNSGWGTSTSLTLTQVTVTELYAALYTACDEPAYIECWDGVNGTLDLTAFVDPNTDYLVRVWNGGSTEAGTFAICVESDFGMGVQESEVADVLLYPNPANDMLRIRGVVDIPTVAVIDLQGRTVLTAPTLGSHEITLPTNALAPGSYIVRIGKNTGRVLGRFVKQ